MNMFPLPCDDESMRSSESDLLITVGSVDDELNRLARFSSCMAFELFVSWVPFPRVYRRL